jgi:hypothetical protein
MSSDRKIHKRRSGEERQDQERVKSEPFTMSNVGMGWSKRREFFWSREVFFFSPLATGVTHQPWPTLLARRLWVRKPGGKRTEKKKN